jgi:MOSC domain-containing protein YiiM
MTAVVGKVVSVHAGLGEDLSKEAQDSIQLELDGVVGDRHRSSQRTTWEGDKQPKGTVRRNERHWSAVSVEEIQHIEKEMDLAEPLSAASLGANLCLEGVPGLSRLAKGSLLKFSSGVELMIEEYNPPCRDMGKKLASLHSSKSGEALADTAFSQAAKFSRGVVGVVEVAGAINTGDEVTVQLYQPPKWLRNPD